MGALGVRIWEFMVVASVVLAFWYWAKFMRTKYLLGVYLGFALCFSWTWLLDTPFLLNIQFNPAAIGGWTWYGHWEPLWTAFSYCAVTIFVMLYLKNKEAYKAKLGNWSIPVIVLISTVAIMFYEGGLGVGLLGVERYNIKPGFLFLNIPLTNTLVLVPVMIALSMLLGEVFEKLLRRAGEVTMANPEDLKGTPLGSGSWTSLLLGFAVPQVSLYVAYTVLIILLNALSPWTTGTPFQNLW